jgi:hypothetical protein
MLLRFKCPARCWVRETSAFRVAHDVHNDPDGHEGQNLDAPRADLCVPTLGTLSASTPLFRGHLRPPPMYVLQVRELHAGGAQGRPGGEDAAAACGEALSECGGTLPGTVMPFVRRARTPATAAAVGEYAKVWVLEVR